MTSKGKNTGVNSDRPPLRLLSAVFLLTFVTFVVFGCFIWSSYKNIKESMQQSIRIAELKGTILLYDEVLTMSARMASASGDIYWEKRYEKFEPDLDLAIKQLISISPESFIGESAEKTDTANVKLVAIEKQAFREVRKGNLDKAKALLDSEAYQREKEVYTAGMQQIERNIEVQTDELINAQSKKVLIFFLSLIVTMPLLIITWVVTYRTFILYIDERKQAEGRMEHLNRVLRAIRDVNQLITQETNPATLLRRSCEVLTSTRGYRSAWVALRDVEGDLDDIAESGFGEDFGAVRAALEKGDWPECYRRALEHTDGIAVLQDPSVDCRACASTHMHRDTAALAGRLRHAGRDFGVLVIALPKELADDEEERSLFRELIGDIAYALHAMAIEQVRKRVEDQLRFQANIIEHSPVIAAYHDKDLNVVWTNKAHQKATGFSLEEVKGKKCYQVWNLSRPCRGCPVAKAIETGEIASAEFAPDNQDHWPETQVYWSSQAAPFRDEQGSVIGAIEFVTDITERKQAEAKQHKLQSQLNQAQKMESVGRLAGGVAHDFNNMLGVILGHTEFAMENVGSSEPLHADLAEIQKAAQRSSELTRQLLAFARKQTVAPKVLDLNDSITSMLKMLERLIGEDIDLLWKPGPGLWPVKIDPAQIDQILANLCVNARDAIADVGKVTIETDKVVFEEAYCKERVGFLPGEYSMMAVSDDGCGMNAETRTHLFEPFFSTKELGKGTGLGLATVYGIVRQNSGFINVYSEPGQGTTIKIYLPRHAATMAKMKEIKPQAAERGSETILLVEDEPAILKMTARMLERLGYTVITAPTSGEAIRLASEHAGEIQLLMTDVVMPEMNGRELANNLQSLYPKLRWLFMSGYTANVVAHHGVLDEGVNFIQKPFSMDDLAGKLRKALDD